MAMMNDDSVVTYLTSMRNLSLGRLWSSFGKFEGAHIMDNQLPVSVSAFDDLLSTAAVL